MTNWAIDRSGPVASYGLFSQKKQAVDQHPVARLHIPDMALVTKSGDKVSSSSLSTAPLATPVLTDTVIKIIVARANPPVADLLSVLQTLWKLVLLSVMRSSEVVVLSLPLTSPNVEQYLYSILLSVNN